MWSSHRQILSLEIFENENWAPIMQNKALDPNEGYTTIPYRLDTHKCVYTQSKMNESII